MGKRRLIKRAKRKAEEKKEKEEKEKKKQKEQEDDENDHSYDDYDDFWEPFFKERDERFDNVDSENEYDIESFGRQYDDDYHEYDLWKKTEDDDDEKGNGKKKENYDGKEEDDNDGKEDLISKDDHLGIVSREQLEIKIQELLYRNKVLEGTLLNIRKHVEDETNLFKNIYGQYLCLICKDGTYRSCGALTRHIEVDHGMNGDAYDDFEAIDGYENLSIMHDTLVTLIKREIPLVETNENYGSTFDLHDALVSKIKREIPLVESNEEHASTFGQIKCLLCRDGIYRSCGVLTRHIEDEHGMHPDAYEAMEEAMDKGMDEAMAISIMLDTLVPKKSREIPPVKSDKRHKENLDENLFTKDQIVERDYFNENKLSYKWDRFSLEQVQKVLCLIFLMFVLGIEKLSKLVIKIRKRHTQHFSQYRLQPLDSSVLTQVHVCSVEIAHLTSVWKLKVKFFCLENIRSHMYLLQQQRDGIG